VAAVACRVGCLLMLFARMEMQIWAECKSCVVTRMILVGAYSDRSINSQEALLARVDLGRYAGWIRTDLHHLLLLV
jgi:hypothetical protein